MNIGDKVRMLRGREEGIITAIINPTTVEMAIEGDFRFPVSRKDLVLVSAHESIAFGGKNGFTASSNAQSGEPVSTIAPPIIQKGIFAAFEQSADQKIILHLINNTDFQIAYTLDLEIQERFQGVACAILQSRQTAVAHHLSIQNFDTWPAFVWQFIYHKTGFHVFEPMLQRRLRITTVLSVKNQVLAPVLNTKVWLFQLDITESLEQTKPNQPSYTAEQIKEKMFEKPLPIPETKNKNRFDLSREIDLHIEQIASDHQSLPADQIFIIQKQTFEKQLDRAIADGVSQIIFIHGVGNGILRAEIHKQLSRHPHVGFYKDAGKEKFGYGATHAQLK